MIQEYIIKLVRESYERVMNESACDLRISIDTPVREEFGDYAAVIECKMLPRDIRRKIAENVKDEQKIFVKIDFLPPVFINFFLSAKYLQEQVEEILKQKEKFGNLKIGKGKKVQVEFISANPTGPLTLGNGRGGFCGDVLANVLAKAGYKVEREYYVNDRGEQIRILGHSVIKDSEAVYKGDYIDGLRKKVKGDNPDEVGEKAGEIILKEMIKPTVKKMGIKYDNWFSEKSLYEKKETDKVLGWLRKQDLAYEKDGALWFCSTKYGDDKDRVLIKADGEKTYFTSDVAYTKNKFERGFDKLIYFLGADHYGYVKRMQGVVQALGYKKEQAQFIVMQLVRLSRKGKEVRMSKREGVYVTLDELINEVGLDAARFFFLMRSPGSHLNFDLDLAKEQSEKNPVYYVQYAHARICSILEKSKSQNLKISKCQNEKLKVLTHSSELALIKQLLRLPEIIEDTARDYQVQRLPRYAQDLATAFHQFYTECRVLDENNKPLTQARLTLVKATKIVLKNTLSLMGITAPEEM